MISKGSKGTLKQVRHRFQLKQIKAGGKNSEKRIVLIVWVICALVLALIILVPMIRNVRPRSSSAVSSDSAEGNHTVISSKESETAEGHIEKVSYLVTYDGNKI
jgi:beta-lactamase regulating signal transducer with metallopeptidase domain